MSEPRHRAARRAHVALQGGGLFGFDRADAIWSVVVGALGVLMGVLVMLD